MQTVDSNTKPSMDSRIRPPPSVAEQATSPVATILGTFGFPSDLGRAAQKAIDHAAFAGTNMRATVGGELLQDDARRHRHPAAIEQGVPFAVVVDIGPGRAAIAFDSVDRAVAAREARARLLQLLIPVMILGMATVVVTILCQGRRESARAEQDAGRNDTNKRASWHEGCHLSQTLLSRPRIRSDAPSLNRYRWPECTPS